MVPLAVKGSEATFKKKVKQLSKSRKEGREILESKIENFEKNENPSQDEFADYEESKIELEKKYDHITDSIILRSKAQWYEEGEKASKYFFTSDKNRKAILYLQLCNDVSTVFITNELKNIVI